MRRKLILRCRNCGRSEYIIVSDNGDKKGIRPDVMEIDECSECLKIKFRENLEICMVCGEENSQNCSACQKIK